MNGTSTRGVRAEDRGEPVGARALGPSGGAAADPNARRALVFGGGGVLGFAWTVGALRALEVEWGVDATAVALNVGTSAGSTLAALLGCGIGADAIRRHHQGIPAPADPGIDWDYRRDSGGALPPWPGLRPGSPRLVLDAVRHPKSMPPAVALSGLLPRGRGTLEPIRAVISAAAGLAYAADDRRGAAGPDDGRDGADDAPGAGDPDGADDPHAADDPDGADDPHGAAAKAVRPGTSPARGGAAPAAWPVQPQTWIVATDYESGARVVFGRDRELTGPVDLGDAVAASCAIPAWYSPVSIGSRLYIDGGSASNASADVVEPLIAAGAVDEVFILAPMASVEPDRPRSPVARLERLVRRAVTRGIQHDAARLRAAGARVVLLTPGPYDLDVMGANLMNPRRRSEVLETSLLSSATTVRELRLSMGIQDGLEGPPVGRGDDRGVAAPVGTGGTAFARPRAGMGGMVSGRGIVR